MKKLLNSCFSSKKAAFLFLLILLLFSFLHFYRLPQRTIFNWDQERDAFEVKKFFPATRALSARAFWDRKDFS